MISTVIALGFSTIALVVSQTYTRRDDFHELEKRVSSMESAVKSLPTQQDFHQLQIRLTEIHGDLKAIRPELRQLNRLHDAIISAGGKDK